MLARYTHPTADRKVAALEAGFVGTDGSHGPDSAEREKSHRHGKAPVTLERRKLELVDRMGFEPTTSALRTQRSPN